jgi:dCMP deaminase
MEKWDKRFLKLAHEVASWSKDKSTRVGAIIVDEYKIVRSVGYNGIPRNLNDNLEHRNNRPLKYKYFSHAEENCLSNMNIVGISSLNCTMYVTMCPCSSCSRNIIQSGIKEVVYLNTSDHCIHRWEDDAKISLEMLNEAGILVRNYERGFINDN